MRGFWQDSRIWQLSGVYMEGWIFKNTAQSMIWFLTWCGETCCVFNMCVCTGYDETCSIYGKYLCNIQKYRRNYCILINKSVCYLRGHFKTLSLAPAGNEVGQKRQSLEIGDKGGGSANSDKNSLSLFVFRLSWIFRFYSNIWQKRFLKLLIFGWNFQFFSKLFDIFTDILYFCS